MLSDKRKVSYLPPVRIVDYEGNFENLETLLKEKDPQIHLFEDDVCTLRGKGYIILDFGKELCGGIRIINGVSWTSGTKGDMHIRFGESVGESCSTLRVKYSTNDMALRDIIVPFSPLGDQCFGDTAFRFVRIDFLNESTYVIKNIFAKSLIMEFDEIKKYNFDDPLVQRIFDVAKYTVTLCVQNSIWDGVKRDRLVWVGDMEPEVRSLLYLYGNIPEIEEALIMSEKHNPLPGWMNNIPSYSVWYLLILNDVFAFTKDKAFIKRHEDYFTKLLAQINNGVTKNGHIEYTPVTYSDKDKYFLDWPTKDALETDKENCQVDLFMYVMPKVKKMCEENNINTKDVDEIIRKVSKVKTYVTRYKQFSAFHQLVYKDKESYESLIKDGAKGLSTFMSYFILSGIANYDKNKALDILKEYYGAMLNRGATTFWEDFDIDWVKDSGRIDEVLSEDKKDIHGDYGKYCYTGYRHSLCHGWSSGPISFLIENFLK